MKPLPSILRVTDPIYRKGNFSPPATTATAAFPLRGGGQPCLCELGLRTSGPDTGEEGLASRCVPLLPPSGLGTPPGSGTAPAILGKVLPSSAFQCPPSMNGIWRGGEREGGKGTRSLRTLGVEEAGALDSEDSEVRILISGTAVVR